MERPDVNDSIRRHPSSLAPPERHRRFGPWGIFAVVVSAVGIVGGVFLSLLAMGGHSKGTGGAVGAQAPEFDLTSLDGRDEVQLSTLRGRVVVVTFERPSCGACRRSETALDLTWRRYRFYGVSVMGIRRETPTVAATGGTPGPWPVLADPHGDTAEAYGVRDEIETFVIDGNGKVVAALDGPVTAPALAAQLASVLGIPATTAPATPAAPTTVESAAASPSTPSTSAPSAAATGTTEPSPPAPSGPSPTA